jgi:hypothetical protein
MRPCFYEEKGMILATVKIRNKHNGKVRIVNEHEWSRDLGLGKYSGWERMGGETIAVEDTDVVEAAAKKALAEKRAEEEAAAKKALAEEEAAQEKRDAVEAEVEAAAAEPEGEKTIEEMLDEESETLFGDGVARGIDLD